jgi:hypothetical protein
MVKFSADGTTAAGRRNDEATYRAATTAATAANIRIRFVDTIDALQKVLLSPAQFNVAPLHNNSRAEVYRESRGGGIALARRLPWPSAGTSVAGPRLSAHAASLEVKT